MSEDLREMDELEPCPLCGSSELRVELYELFDCNFATILHMCKETGMKSSMTRKHKNRDTAINRVIKAWNSLSKGAES